MDRIVRGFPIILSLFLSPIALADCDWTDLSDWGMKPNLGIDVGIKNQSFNSSFGEEHFRQDYPETNIYFGIKFHPYIGIEAGYEYMYRQERLQYYNIGFGVLGSAPTLPGGLDQRVFNSDVHGQGWNVSLLGFWPICPRTKTELTLALGLAWQKLYYSTAVALDSDPATPLAMWSSDTRAMFRAGVGIRQMITKHFGSRLQVFWEDTSKLSATFPIPVGQGGVLIPTTPADNYTVRPRDNYSVLLGFFFQIT